MPGMWERTITFGSGGKTFGVTGWRIGWAIGPHDLLKSMLAIHARTVFTTPTPLQDAVAAGFEHAIQSDHFDQMRSDYKRRRDVALNMFQELGMPVAIPHGSYFFMVNTGGLTVDLPRRPSEESTDPTVMENRDYAVCRWTTEHLGVTFIPPSAFYEPQNKHLADNLIRVCFCKSDETLADAKQRMQKIAKYLK